MRARVAKRLSRATSTVESPGGHHLLDRLPGNCLERRLVLLTWISPMIYPERLLRTPPGRTRLRTRLSPAECASRLRTICAVGPLERLWVWHPADQRALAGRVNARGFSVSRLHRAPWARDPSLQAIAIVPIVARGGFTAVDGGTVVEIRWSSRRVLMAGAVIAIVVIAVNIAVPVTELAIGAVRGEVPGTAILAALAAVLLLALAGRRVRSHQRPPDDDDARSLWPQRGFWQAFPARPRAGPEVAALTAILARALDAEVLPD